MKNSILTLTLALIASIGTLCAATFPKFIAEDSRSFNLDLSDWKTQEVEVRIADETGVIVMTEMISVDKIGIRKYNLKNLATGKYIVTVSDQYRKVMQPIMLDTKNVLIDTANARITYKPIITVSNSKVDVNYLVLGKDVSIEFLNNDYDVLDVKSYQNVKILNKRFDLSGLADGTYYININTDNGSYSQAINVDNNYVTAH